MHFLPLQRLACAQLGVEFAMAMGGGTGHTFVALGTQAFSNSEALEEVPEGPISWPVHQETMYEWGDS